MISERDYEAANRLYGELLKKGFLPMNHTLVQPYKEEEGVRIAIKKWARMWRTDIHEHEEHLHLVAEPEGCIFATSLSEMKNSRKYTKSFEDKIDFFLISTIICTFFSELESGYDVKLSIDNEGISFPQLEELVNNTLENWKQIDDEKNGAFSTEFGLAVKEMSSKWQRTHFSRANKKITANQKTKMGYIMAAMSLLEKEGLVYISKQHKTSYIVFPKQQLYERMQSVLPELDRYHVLKALIQESKNEMVKVSNTKEETA